MKILFYDVKDFELNYLLERVSNKIEPTFLKTTLNEQTYIDEKHLDTEAISCFVNSQLNKKVLSKFKKLKYVFLRCVGYSNVDLEYCKENDIKIYNAANYGNSTVAEFTFALILSISKKINQAQNSIKFGLIDANELMGIELCSKTIGVIGVGAIGRKVVNIAHGFNMNVLAYDIEQKGAYNFVSLDELLAKSDFISINCPLNSQTKGMINRNAFLKMKKDAILINVARGEIVDTMALYWALVNKKIYAAALDVVECEEILCQTYKKCANNDGLKLMCLKKFFFIQKLLHLPNVIITPHNAYNTKEAQIRILNTTLENIDSIFDNKYGAKNLVLI